MDSAAAVRVCVAAWLRLDVEELAAWRDYSDLATCMKSMEG